MIETTQNIEHGETVTAKSGLVFITIGTTPYTRKDGTRTILKVWRSNCIVCGEPFTVTTPLNFEGSKAFGCLHCQAHKLSKAQVIARWAAGRKRAAETCRI